MLLPVVIILFGSVLGGSIFWIGRGKVSRSWQHSIRPADFSSIATAGHGERAADRHRLVSQSLHVPLLNVEVEVGQPGGLAASRNDLRHRWGSFFVWMLDFSVMQNTDRMLTEEKAIRSRDIGQTI